MIIFERYIDWQASSKSSALFPRPGVSDAASVVTAKPMLEAAKSFHSCHNEPFHHQSDHEDDK